MRRFASGEDIHTRTAAEVFGLDPAEVTPERREAAKAINFGIVYGISSFGLAKGTGLSQEDAQRYIDAYFARYPGVKAYIEKIKAVGREQGYVTTLFKPAAILAGSEKPQFRPAQLRRAHGHEHAHSRAPRRTSSSWPWWRPAAAKAEGL